MKKVILGTTILIMLLVISACGSDNSSQVTSNKESSSQSDTNMKQVTKILSEENVVKKDDSLIIVNPINATTEIKVIFDLLKKDGFYTIESPTYCIRTQVGTSSLITDVSLETDNNKYTYDMSGGVMDNYDGIHKGKSQAMAFTTNNEEDSTPLMDVVSDMAESDGTIVDYGGTITGQQGSLFYSKEEAQKMKKDLELFQSQAQVLENQKIKIDELTSCLENGHKKLLKTYNEKRQEAKKNLTDFIKISDGDTIYYLKNYQSVMYTGIVLYADQGNIQSVEPVISIAYPDVKMDDITFEIENEKFLFDNNYDDSFIDSIETNGKVYNFPMSTYYGLDIYSVIQSLSNASSVLMEFSSDDSYDNNKVNFEHPEVFEGIYKDLTMYDEQFTCLEGLKLSDLDKIGQKNDKSNHNKTSDNESWSSSKSDELSSFMSSWSQEMNQHYSKMSFDDTIATFGNHSLDNLVDDSVNPLVEGSSVKFSYDASGDYQVVAIYDGETNDGTDTTYVFTIGKNGPVVLVAQGNNNDESVSFKPTANTALQNGFINIVTN